MRKEINSVTLFPTFRIPLLYYPTFRIPSLYYPTFIILSLNHPTFIIPSLYYPTLIILSLNYPTLIILSLNYPTFRIPFNIGNLNLVQQVQFGERLKIIEVYEEEVNTLFAIFKIVYNRIRILYIICNPYRVGSGYCI